MPQHYPGGQPDYMSNIDRIFTRTKTAAQGQLPALLGGADFGGAELGPIGAGGYSQQAPSFSTLDDLQRLYSQGAISLDDPAVRAQAQLVVANSMDPRVFTQWQKNDPRARHDVAAEDRKSVV